MPSLRPAFAATAQCVKCSSQRRFRTVAPSAPQRSSSGWPAARMHGRSTRRRARPEPTARRRARARQPTQRHLVANRPPSPARRSGDRSRPLRTRDAPGRAGERLRPKSIPPIRPAANEARPTSALACRRPEGRALATRAEPAGRAADVARSRRSLLRRSGSSALRKPRVHWKRASAKRTGASLDRRRHSIPFVSEGMRSEDSGESPRLSVGT